MIAIPVLLLAAAVVALAVSVETRPLGEALLDAVEAIGRAWRGER